ncbi:thrombopoietin receptor [Eucyclogobius newberryi]|uniref:thrombopoietin receptor n=1 Tax=Eucyclogobius newberryi TaxID=166745 RepID=UPI003B5C4A8C
MDIAHHLDEDFAAPKGGNDIRDRKAARLGGQGECGEPGVSFCSSCTALICHRASSSRPPPGPEMPVKGPGRLPAAPKNTTREREREGEVRGWVALWTLVVFTSGTSRQETANLSEEDDLHLKDQNPTCFTQMLDGIAKNFTCFIKTRENSSYDFFYTIDNPPRRTKCEVQVQRSEDGGFVHACTFPQSDIFMFEYIPLEVLDRAQNCSLFARTVSVEDNILPEPPSDISITKNEKVGELQVSWKTKCVFTLYYKIKVSSEYMKEEIQQVCAKSSNLNFLHWPMFKSKSVVDMFTNVTDECSFEKGRNKLSETLVGLVPGEDVKVQVSVRCSPSQTTGHWSHWSEHVQAVAPQSAEDISLKCYTQDLVNTLCQWDHGSISNINADYKLFYQMGLSEGQGWTKWTECFPEMNWTGRCGFHGDVHNKLRVKLCSPLAPLNRTFYAEDFKLNNIIKTPAPRQLKQDEMDKLCVTWECPLPALASHLQYETSYKPSAEKHWMTVSSDGPETAVCLKVSWSGQISVKVRAKPHGEVYSGQWSDWSDVLTGEVPAQSRILWLIQCSPILLLVFAVIFISLFYKYFRKLKQYFWPPVPNLDKVLQEFLSDLNKHKWDDPATAKHFYAETISSVVEVVSKVYDPGSEGSSEKSGGLLSSTNTSCSSVGRGNSSLDAELCPDYVALNRNNVIVCSKENSYIYEEHKEEDTSAVIQQHSPHCSEYSLPSDDFLGVSDFLNHSYLLLATDNLECKENKQRGRGNIYTNMPCN